MMATDEKNNLKTLPILTLLLIVIFFVLVLFSIIGILFPQYRNIENAKNDRISKMLILEEQKKIFPLFAQADALARINFDPKLPFSERKPLGRDQIFSLSTVFSDIALKNNMKLAQNSHDINSLNNHSNLISMDIQFTGSLFGYRNCLISLAELPFFNTIEKIKISTDPSNIKTFFTKILIRIEPVKKYNVDKN